MLSKFLTPYLLLAVSATTFASPQRETDIAGYSEAVIRQAMKEHKAPGASFVLVDGQEVIAMRSFGFADRGNRVPVENDTVFKLWSVSKVFTAIELMRLVDEGFVGLDDSVTAHI